MDEEFSLPQPFTGGSTALALPAPSVGSGLESMSSMSPMESMMEIFMEEYQKRKMIINIKVHWM